jgi:rubrerythrin
MCIVTPDRVDPIGVLGDGTWYYAPIGELVHDGDDRVLCHLCGRWMKIIGGTHVRWHGWTLERYRDTFQLRQADATCAPALSNRLRETAKMRVGHRGFGKPPGERTGSVARIPSWRLLAHVRPDLLAELHPTRNGKLVADALAAGSHRELWWQCGTCGHEWRAPVDRRVSRGSGCPTCAVRRRAHKRRRVAPERSLAHRNPELAGELHPTRNGTLNPTAVGVASSQTVWWRCRRCGNEWQAVIANRSAGTGCPACWKQRRGITARSVPPHRSLLHQAPELADELHPTRNGDLDPATLGAHSDRKVWWRCAICGYEWRARVADRTAGSGCPACAGRA